MTIVSPTPADVMTLLASQTTLAILRSLTDAQWTTTEQIAEATGYSEFVVATQMAGIRASGIVETLGELYRLDTLKLNELFALMTADLPGV